MARLLNLNYEISIGRAPREHLRDGSMASPVLCLACSNQTSRECGGEMLHHGLIARPRILIVIAYSSSRSLASCVQSAHKLLVGIGSKVGLPFAS